MSTDEIMLLSRATMIKKVFLPLTLLILLGVVWGSGYVIAKFAMTHGVPPLGYSFWQSLGPAILLSIIALLYTRTIPVSRSHLIYYAICGLVGITLPNTNMYFAAPHLPSGILALIVNTVPMFTYALALLVGQEKFCKWRMLGVFCTLGGILFIILPKASLPTPAMIPWILMTLITPFLFAVCVIYVNARRPTGTSSLSLAAGMLLASTLMLSPSVLFSHHFYPLWPPFSLADWAIILEIILSSVGYVLLFILLRLAGPVYYSLVGGVVVLTGLFWGWFIFNEQLNIWLMMAIALLFIGIGLVSLKITSSGSDTAIAAMRLASLKQQLNKS
jgi:drug/metabolite transporter (DMT)-like permease